MTRPSKLLLAAAFSLLGLAACGDSPAKTIPVASVAVTPSDVTLIVGSTQQLTATTKDAQSATLTDRAVSWTSTNGAVATVSNSGLVSSIAPGTAQIRATSEGVTGTANFTVMPVPVASVTVTAPSATMLVGEAQQAVATARDVAGNVLTGRTIAWSSSNPAAATVDAAGRVTANAPGGASIIATVELQSGSTTVTVVLPAPSISTITPATLVPGATATITGTGFDTSLGGTSVSVRGAVASINSATTTQLVITVPCVESGSAEVRVSTIGRAPVTRAHPVSVTSRSIAVGQPLILTSSSASSCNELAPTGGPARYLVVVSSAATSPGTTNAFELAGNTPAAAIAEPAIVTLRASSAPSEPQSPEQLRLARQERVHWAHLERDRLEYQRLMADPRARRESRQSNQATREAADVAVGDAKDMFYTLGAGCNDVSRVMSVKAIRVGTRSIIWEDVANSLQSSADAPLAGFYERIGQIFDQEQYESVKRSFGDPLLRDADTDNDGKIAMVFSERLNGSGAAAYVTSCDQRPQSISPGSNFGQYFYGSVPTTAGSNLNSSSFPDGWFYFMGRTVVHEVKHIASLSARVANGSPFEESWLEEGTARHAEELWARESLHHVPFRGNTGFGTAANNGLYCDFHPSDGTCNALDPLRRPSYGMRRQFNEIRDKLLQPWNWSPYGDASGQTGFVFYQSSWSLVRYTIDRYAISDSAFFRALINANTTGVTNLTAVAGASIDQLIGGWGLALFADDYPGLVNPSPDIQFATWNLRNIYSSLNAAPLWTSRWNTPFPIAPLPLTTGAFVAQVPTIRGGAHAYFEITGSFNTPQLLNLRTNATTAPSPNLRIAITRLQ